MHKFISLILVMYINC